MSGSDASSPATALSITRPTNMSEAVHDDLAKFLGIHRMPTELSWYIRIWTFISAVAQYWEFWLAVAFMSERALERFFQECGSGLIRIHPERRNNTLTLLL